jgi:hypothetical protein
VPYCPSATYLPHFFFLRAAAALSTKFGYGRPAALARAFAAAFCAGVSVFDFALGFFVSQNAFFFIGNYNPKREATCLF